MLPYGKEIDRCATEGGMFNAISYCNPKYTASLNRVLEALDPGETEQLDDAPQGQQEDNADEQSE